MLDCDKGRIAKEREARAEEGKRAVLPDGRKEFPVQLSKDIQQAMMGSLPG